MLEQKTIRAVVSKGSQSLIYYELLKLGPHTCQISIESDSYRFQCHARAEIWSSRDLRWNPVTSVHFSQTATKSGLASAQIAGPTDFATDRDTLVTQLIEVLQ